MIFMNFLLQILPIYFLIGVVVTIYRMITVRQVDAPMWMNQRSKFLKWIGFISSAFLWPFRKNKD